LKRSLARLLRRFHSSGESRTPPGRADEPGWPSGHFYSPYPDLGEVARRASVLFGSPPRVIAGVDLREDAQLGLLDELARFYPDLPFTAHERSGLRYFFENPNYSYGEAIVLYCMIRHLRPQRIVEVGSGYSSCAILDTNDLAFDGAIECAFIDPYPQLLKSLVGDDEQRRLQILAVHLQDVESGWFARLSEGDILFVDSSHVSKIGSDVNHLFFAILPLLNDGVYVHFHDIPYPFEYPKEWIFQRRAWNEAYLLRAFLQYNAGFTVEFFNSFMGRFHGDALARAMPLAMKNPGTSLWLRKGSASQLPPSRGG
jgi:hypothetical protein